MVLVQRPFTQLGHEALPHAGRAARGQRVVIGIPVVEIAYDGDAFGIRSPHREVGAGLAVEFGEVRTKLFIQLGMVALVEQMKVKAGDERGFLSVGLLGRRLILRSRRFHSGVVS